MPPLLNACPVAHPGSVIRLNLRVSPFSIPSIFPDIVNFCPRACSPCTVAVTRNTVRIRAFFILVMFFLPDTNLGIALKYPKTPEIYVRSPCYPDRGQHLNSGPTD